MAAKKKSTKKKSHKKKHYKTNHDVVRVNGALREIVTVKDAAGNTLHKMMRPLMLEFKLGDVVQVIVGAALLAMPIGLTEEAYAAAERIPMVNAYIITLLSLMFVSIFVYYYYYRGHLEHHYWEFIKRVLTTYVLSFVVVAGFLLLIQQISFADDANFAIKLIILASFPASMSAAVADIFK